jgi:hypothetical protein
MFGALLACGERSQWCIGQEQIALWQLLHQFPLTTRGCFKLNCPSVRVKKRKKHKREKILFGGRLQALFGIALVDSWRSVQIGM